MRRNLRIVFAILASLALLAGAAVAFLYFLLRASLPDLEGESSAAGLQAEATIERDALGIVTIRARNRNDLAWATGYAHGQDRFFQMDLSRRFAAGELAEMFGAAALPGDRRMRLHRFRAVAREVVRRAAPAERELLQRYAQGVNAGVRSLSSRPFEYWLFSGEPAAWLAEDSMLVALAMYVDLTYSGFESEAMRGSVRDAVPEALYRFIYSSGNEWDAPLTGAAFAVDPVPAPSIYDLRRLNPPEAVAVGTVQPRVESVEAAPGSNNWAVAGAHTATGAALVANDMHLGLAVPNTWYRARLQLDPQGSVPPGGSPLPPGEQKLDLNGVTLPGTPLLVVGSNGVVAWGFTNSYGDWTDLVQLEVDSATPERYATPDGDVPFETVIERIRVKGQEDDLLEFRQTIWGPVFDADSAGRPRAAVWTAHDPAATNLASLQLETARSATEALDIAARSGIPPQNFVVADAAGNIGWTIMGRIPVRSGYDPLVPSSWSAQGVGWHGWLAPEAYPRLVNPPQGRIWTANARVVDGAALEAIGDGGYALGVRAGQIRDALMGLETATEHDMLAIQLDDRGRIYERWRSRLVGQLDEAAIRDRPLRAEALRLVRDWEGHAAADSAGFRILRLWRDRVRTQVFASLVRDVPRQDEEKKLRAPSQFEGPLWELVQAEPAHLLDPQFESWSAFELAQLDEVLAEMLTQCKSLAVCTWGKQNRAKIRHPVSRAVPALAFLLDMPGVELPGDTLTPRAQTPTFGASERFAVSPGHESAGYLHMPGGQSGHPLSPYYRKGFDSWAQGLPLPFLPGPPEHRLTLHPAK